LEFPETITTKIAAINAMKKKISKAAENEAKSGKDTFKPASYLKECFGCLNCNYCNFRKKNVVLKKEEQVALNEKYLKQMKKAEDPETTKYIDDMRELKKKLNLDDNYFKKFGMLKKANALLYYGRENEALDEIAKAVEIA
jgi:hypothetical protein